MSGQWLSHVWLLVTPWTVHCQAPLSMGILQAIILEWVSMPSSRGNSQPRDWTQVSNPGLLHCRWIIHHLNHQGSLRILEWVTNPFSRGSSQPKNKTGVSCIAGKFFTSWATKEVLYIYSVQFISVAQSCLTLCDPMNHSMPRLPVHHQLLEFTQSMSIQLVMPSNHLIFCHLLLLLPSIFPSIRVFLNESALLNMWPKYWSFSFNISLSNEYSGRKAMPCRLSWMASVHVF